MVMKKGSRTANGAKEEDEGLNEGGAKGGSKAETEAEIWLTIFAVCDVVLHILHPLQGASLFALLEEGLGN